MTLLLFNDDESWNGFWLNLSRARVCVQRKAIKGNAIFYKRVLPFRRERVRNECENAVKQECDQVGDRAAIATKSNIIFYFVSFLV